jgi:hypothetical protein
VAGITTYLTSYYMKKDRKRLPLKSGETRVSTLLCPTQAHPRNLTGDDGKHRKDKRWEMQETKYLQNWGQVSWALRWRHTTAPSTSSEFITYSGKMRRSNSSQGRQCEL